MASDILLYKASYVPVGDDQTQHLEFTRDIAERMNSQFSDLFVVPKSVKEQHEFFDTDQGLRIMDLADPTKKMSKSDESGKGVIFLTDTIEAAKQKLMSATTDSLNKIAYDKQNQPGLANLLELLSLISSEPLDSIVSRYSGQTQYGPLKNDLADRMTIFLQEFQGKLSNVSESQIEAKLQESEALMNKQANLTLNKVQKAVGLRS